MYVSYHIHGFTSVVMSGMGVFFALGENHGSRRCVIDERMNCSSVKGYGIIFVDCWSFLRSQAIHMCAFSCLLVFKFYYDLV
jgi:hypothetical protein